MGMGRDRGSTRGNGVGTTLAGTGWKRDWKCIPMQNSNLNSGNSHKYI